MVTLLAGARPRLVQAILPPPVRLFTDGACEPAGNGTMTVTIGGVLFLPGRVPSFFGCTVPEEVTRRWASRSDAQVIGQAELLPVVVAKLIWGPLLVDAALVTYVDNDAARFGLVAGASACASSAELIGASARLDARGGIAQWVARVPSAANIADGPSRLEFGLVEQLGGTRVECGKGCFGHLRSWRALADWISDEGCLSPPGTA